MSRFGKCFLLAVACALAFQADAAERAAPALKSPVLETGAIGEAPFRIDIPGNWNGDLVVLAHGFEPVGAPRPSPMPPNEATPVFLSAGYAVAQSGYSSQGWAVRDAVADIELLRQRFIQQHGAARRAYLVGFSMGGGIAIASLEQHASRYDGALSLCGANVPGARLAEELFTTLVAFDFFFPGAQGLGGGLSDFGAAAVAPPPGDVFSSIAGALAGKPEVATRLAEYVEVPVDALPGAVGLRYLVFQDMVQRAGGLPVDNRKTVYRGFDDDEAFNAGVRRYAGSAAAMAYVASAPALSGHPGKPLVIQYNHGDPTITPRLQSIFAGLAPTAGKPAALTLPAVGEGHCGFSPEQIGQAFQTLTRWVESGQRPATE